jgi:hypothetical protein
MTTDNFCFYFQNRLIRTSKTGGQRYSDTSPFSIPWYNSQGSVDVSILPEDANLKDWFFQTLEVCGLTKELAPM